MKLVMLLLAILVASTGDLQAGWLQIGENDRLVTYVDTTTRTNGNNVVAWVLFDYKSVQKTPRSGKRYSSEKAQYEIDVSAEKARVLFFTWHSARMGNGTVVYTGNKPTAWEPTSSPNSIANVLWKYIRGESKVPASAGTRSPLPKTGDNQTVEQVAAEIAKIHNAANITDEMTVSSTAEARGKQIVFKSVLRVQKDLPKKKLEEFRGLLQEEIVPKTCMVNANKVAFMEMGLYYTFVYFNTYGQKLAEITVDRAVYDKWKASR